MLLELHVELTYFLCVLKSQPRLQTPRAATFKRQQVITSSIVLMRNKVHHEYGNVQLGNVGVSGKKVQLLKHLIATKFLFLINPHQSGSCANSTQEKKIARSDKYAFRIIWQLQTGTIRNQTRLYSPPSIVRRPADLQQGTTKNRVVALSTSTEASSDLV